MKQVLPSSATVSDALTWAVQALTDVGAGSPRREAEWLLADLLSTTRANLYLNAHRIIPTQNQRECLRASVARRGQHVPIQHVLGKTEFYALPFSITPDVLIPRPETEILVDALIVRFKSVLCPKILDIGTGSGAIAVALARNLDSSRLIATDISLRTLNVASENARLNDTADRISFVLSDLFSALRPAPLFHAVVSNPPYVTSGELLHLPEEVREHEPGVALDGGPDGLRFYFPLIEKASNYLRPKGWLAMEVDDRRAHLVSSLLSQTFEFGTPETIRDLSGRNRALLAQKRPARLP